MGLKINSFKKNGGVFVDAYAKVSGVNYNNETKIASFGISIYTSKTDKNLICEIKNQWAKINAGTDMVAQCYDKINSNINQLKNQIAANQIEIDSIVDNDNLKLRKEHMNVQLKADDLLQLDGAIAD